VFLCLREKCCCAHSMTADVPCREDGFVRRFVLSGLAFGLYLVLVWCLYRAYVGSAAADTAWCFDRNGY
jgi:hypothetical protein